MLSEPVIPVIRGWVSYHVRTLLYRGRRLGNHPNIVAKVGDSITRFGYFLLPIASGGLRLGQYGDLQPAAAFFGPSFGRASMAAQNGWMSGDVLDPAHAMPGCIPGERPLDCEYRIAQPSVALIMFGTNDMVRSNVDSFAANLDAILTITEQHGIVPVVSTIPERRDADALARHVNADPYNEVIVTTALAHGVPLWNYWRALNDLPDSGISTDRIHPSVPPDQQTAVFDAFHLRYGFTMRNLNALQVLSQLLPYVQGY